MITPLVKPRNIRHCFQHLSISQYKISDWTKFFYLVKIGLIYLCLVFFKSFFHLLELLLVVVKSKSFSPSASMAFHVVINRLLTSRCRLDIHYSERDRHPTRPLLHVEQVSCTRTCKVSLRAASSHYAARIQNT